MFPRISEDSYSEMSISWRKRWDCSDCWPQGKELDLGGVLDVRQIRPADGLHMRGEEKRGIKDE